MPQLIKEFEVYADVEGDFVGPGAVRRARNR
jgi:hypothetical protein